jgi:hypothetical protein
MEAHRAEDNNPKEKATNNSIDGHAKKSLFLRNKTVG